MAQFMLIKPGTHIKFVEHHKPVIALMLLLCIAGLIFAFIKGPNWGTSFQGGTSINIHLMADNAGNNSVVTVKDVENAFANDTNLNHVSVQTLGNEGENKFVIRTRTTTVLTCDKFAAIHDKFNDALHAATANNTLSLKESTWPLCDDDGIRSNFDIAINNQSNNPDISMPPEQIQKALNDAGFEDVEVAVNDVHNKYTIQPTGIQSQVVSILTKAFGERFYKTTDKGVQTGLDSVSTIGADVGEKFRNDAIVSILLALGFMLLYIGIRFDTRYAPAAVISLTVTTLLTACFIVFLQLEITLETVAALLSLVGYGINDTIVNFDRVRENVALSDKSVPLEQLVNKAINECISRTIITSITTLLAIAPLIFLATGTTHDFAIIMGFGICVATLNSMFISCPFVIKFDHWFKLYKQRAEAIKTIEMDSNAQLESDIKTPEVVLDDEK